MAGYSRWITARTLPSRSAADLIAGHWRLLTDLGAVPRVLVWDNEGAVGSWRSGGPRLTDEFAAFAGLLGVKFVLCKPRDPEAKGPAERANGYLETSFLPGRVFTSAPDFNVQLADWLTKANRRVHRTLPGPAVRPTRGRPVADAVAAAHRFAGLVEGIATTAAGPLCLPGHLRLLRPPTRHRPPYRGGRRPGTGPGACDGVEVARHARSWARHQTDPDHAAAAAAGRRKAVTKQAAADLTEVEERSLDSYDRIFGVIDGGLTTGEGAA